MLQIQYVKYQNRYLCVVCGFLYMIMLVNILLNDSSPKIQTQVLIIYVLMSSSPPPVRTIGRLLEAEMRTQMLGKHQPPMSIPSIPFVSKEIYKLPFHGNWAKIQQIPITKAQILLALKQLGKDRLTDEMEYGVLSIVDGQIFGFNGIWGFKYSFKFWVDIQGFHHSYLSFFPSVRHIGQGKIISFRYGSGYIALYELFSHYVSHTRIRIH